MPALIAGNTVVFKPASATPLLAVRLVEILEEAGLPTGVINLVLGPGSDRRRSRSSAHPDVALISFTGSTDAGRTSVASAAAAPEARLAGAGRQERDHRAWTTPTSTWRSRASLERFGTTGQRCTAAAA